MNTRADFFELGLADAAPALPREAETEGAAVSPAAVARDMGEFAREQILRLVRQVFAPGRQGANRQVVFSAVDGGTEAAQVCRHAARALAEQVQASVCLVASPDDDDEPVVHRTRIDNSLDDWSLGKLRRRCRELSENLWRLPQEDFWSDHADDNALRNRWGQLRLEFDYTILEGPPLGTSSDSALLGAAADGVVLLLEANVTRRVAAQKAKEMLQHWNARVLGVVLSERTFPIPERLYHRL